MSFANTFGVDLVKTLWWWQPCTWILCYCRTTRCWRNKYIDMTNTNPTRWSVCVCVFMWFFAPTPHFSLDPFRTNDCCHCNDSAEYPLHLQRIKQQYSSSFLRHLWNICEVLGKVMAFMNDHVSKMPRLQKRSKTIGGTYHSWNIFHCSFSGMRNLHRRIDRVLMQELILAGSWRNGDNTTYCRLAYQTRINSIPRIKKRLQQQFIGYFLLRVLSFESASQWWFFDPVLFCIGVWTSAMYIVQCRVCCLRTRGPSPTLDDRNSNGIASHAHFIEPKDANATHTHTHVCVRLHCYVTRCTTCPCRRLHFN